MTNYRNEAWLSEQIKLGRDFKDIAAGCGAAVASVEDAADKFKLAGRPRWHRDHDACQSCGLAVFAPAADDGLCLGCHPTGRPRLATVPRDQVRACGHCGDDHSLRPLGLELPAGLVTYMVCAACSRALSAFGWRASDRDIRRWCGSSRRRVPAQVQEADPITDTAVVLVLGASGFVGTNLIAYLKRATKFNVVGATRADYDATVHQTLVWLLQKYEPDVVINLAAFVGGINLNRERPGDMIYRNLLMGMNAVNACFATGVKKLVHVGTVCSYPKVPPHIPFREGDLWLDRPEPTNEPYGVAKKAVGMMLDAYCRQFNFQAAYLMPTNMYGPHDDFSLHSSHVIPAMIRKFVAARDAGAATVTLWGDGSPTRDFLYVDDFAAALAAAVTAPSDAEPVNIGSGRETAMFTLAEHISGLVGYRGKIIWDSTMPNGQPRRLLDISRARRQLGFEPATSLEDGLRRTVAWYEESYAKR